MAPSTYFYFNNRKRIGGKSVESIIKPLRDYLIESEYFPFEGGDICLIKVKSIDDLAKIAEGLGRPVLLKRVNDKHVTLRLIDGNIVYEYIIIFIIILE